MRKVGVVSRHKGTFDEHTGESLNRQDIRDYEKCIFLCV